MASATPVQTGDVTRLRNVAIIAHVDHGKTTLVDAILAQSGIRLDADGGDCVLDSNPLERERGITILSKNCAVAFDLPDGPQGPGVYRLNVLDTPGHADFGGEVERVLRMADGALLLVDAADGPMPQTRFVLGKALELGLRPIVVINKCDRPEADPDRVETEVFDLLVELGADDDALDFPVVYASGRDGWAHRDRTRSDQGVQDLLQCVIDHVPPPEAIVDAPARLLVTTLDWSEYVGRIAIGRIESGRLRAGMPIVVCKDDGSRPTGRVQRLFAFEGLGRRPADEVVAGDLCAIEGIADLVDIGDTICDPARAEPLPRVRVDEPTLHMVFRINDSPNAGREGTFVTSRQLKERLERELQSNVALRVAPGEGADEFRVSGRGLLHLGVLLEQMRREGYELCVGRPEVVEREIDGERCEPIERLTIDVHDEGLGSVLEMLGARGAEIGTVDHRGARIIVEAQIPARSLIGLRTRVLNATSGEAIMHHAFSRWSPVRGGRASRSNGVLIATDAGAATTYALQNLSDRGVMFVRSGDPIYAGQIVGEHNRDNDLPVNIVKAKAFSNMREATKEATVVLKAPRVLSLESAIEYVEDDELVEITPSAVRLRKRVLSETERRRVDRAAKSRTATGAE